MQQLKEEPVMARHVTTKPVSIAIFACLVAMLVSACGGPPTEALDAARKALLDAEWTQECAEDTYRFDVRTR